jgi:hypothetical protein
MHCSLFHIPQNVKASHSKLLKQSCMQARTHQLLVHNKELLDHIAALVAHLQEQERLQQRHQQVSSNQGQGQQQQEHVTMVPQVGRHSDSSQTWHGLTDTFIA